MPVGEGVSSVLLNTEKAQELFRSVRAEVRSVPRTVQESVMGNGQLQHPSVRHPRYELFRELYPRYGLARSVKVCLRNDRLKLYIKKITNSILFIAQFQLNQKILNQIFL